MPNWNAVELRPGLLLFLEAEDDVLRRATFGKNAAKPPAWLLPSDYKPGLPVLRQAARELAEYMQGKRRVFSLPFELDGTEFQCKVWEELFKIPYGELRCYADIAEAVGRPKAVRAVGAANGANPLPVIVPCHRVIGADGSLAGYGAGVDVKRALLEREGVRL
jgi:O-6-methylguanine DNA methyltransferase